MKNNLCIIGLTKNFTKKLLNKLSAKLDMLYADVNEMLEFDLVDIVEAREKTSASYIDSLETKKIKELASYDNVILGMDYKTFMKNNNSEVARKFCYVLYVGLDYTTYLRALKQDKLIKVEQQLEETVYNENVKFLQQNTDMQIHLNNLNINTAIQKVLKALQTYQY